MNDLISKSEFITSLIDCKELTLGSFEIVSKFLEDYPIRVNMDNIKEQINNIDITSEYEEFIKKDLMNILDKGGV